MDRIMRWIPALLRTLARGVFLYCAYYSFFTLGIPLLKAFNLASPISASGICWSACFIIFAVELAREWPKDVLHSYALEGPVPRLATPSPQDWVPGVGLPVVPPGAGDVWWRLAVSPSSNAVRADCCDRLKTDHVRCSHEQ